MKRVMLPAMPSQNRKRYQLQKSASSSSSSTARGPSVEIDIADNESIPSDSVAAFEAVVQQVSSTSGFPLAIPGCFLHQIPMIIRDRNVVNHELYVARTKGVLRHIHVEGCGLLLCRERDYRGLVQGLLEAARRDQTAQSEADVLERFLSKVLPMSTDLAIPQKRLLGLMEVRKDDEQNAVVTLLRLGFIVFQTHGPDVENESSFWFTLPNMRTLIDEVEAGRSEFVKMIQRGKPHREVMKSKLLAKKKFKGSSLSMEFHIKDAVGSGVVVARDTALEGKHSVFLLPDKLTG